MADRYWVGGSGTWDTTSTTNWASSSGGTSGASVPTSADNVFFDQNSNTGSNAFTVTVTNVALSCLDLTVRNIKGTMTLTSLGLNLTAAGNVVFPVSGLSASTFGGASNLILSGSNKTLNTNGTPIGCNIQISGGSISLAGPLSFTNLGYFNLVSGSFTSNNWPISAVYSFISNSTSVRSLTLGTSAVSIVTRLDFTNPANLTASISNATFTFTGTPGTPWDFGGKSFGHVVFSNPANSTIPIVGGGTFKSWRNTTQPLTFTITSGSTCTFTEGPYLRGTSGNVITLNPSSTTNYTFSRASGSVSANFLSINRCTATGGATWNAGANSTKDANTTGWTLTTAAQELTGASVAGPSTTTANGVAKTTGITLSGNAVASIGLTQAKPINAAIKLTRYFASSVSGNVTTPANALGAPNATYTADGNTANNWTHTWRLETVAPSSNWTYYDGMPITVRFNKGTNSGNPSFSTIRALQGGSAVGTLNTASTSVTTSASGGQDHTFTIQPSWLATATAVDIEITKIGRAHV